MRRFSWLAAVLVAPGLALGLASVALAQGLIMNLVPVGGSGVSGSVTLDPLADGTVRVTVRGRGLRGTSSYLSGAYGETSRTCVGGRIGDFSSVGPGTRAEWSYTVPGPVQNIFSVSIREGTAAPGTVVACADRREPASLPRTGETDVPLWAGGFALAALILLGAGIALRRRAA